MVSYSFPFSSSSDVPQGFFLGRLQFLFFRNDFLVRWCFINTLKVSQCGSICNSSKLSTILFSYSLGSHLLLYRRFNEDVDVTFDDKLGFEKHCLDVWNRASRMSGFVPRTFFELNSTQSSLARFNSLIRRILEYYIMIWSP